MYFYRLAIEIIIIIIIIIIISIIIRQRYGLLLVSIWEWSSK